MSINFNSPDAAGKTPFGQLLKVVGALLALAAAFMFSLVFFAVLAVAGLIFWLYFMWKTRALRRQMREHLAAAPRGAPPFAQGAPESAEAAEAADSAAGGAIIEGEAVRVDNERSRPGE